MLPLRAPKAFLTKALNRLAETSVVPVSAEMEIIRLFARAEDDDYAETHDLLHKASGILTETAEGLSYPWDTALRIVADDIAAIGNDALDERERSEIADLARATLSAPASAVMAPPAWDAASRDRSAA